MSFNNGLWIAPDENELKRIENSILYDEVIEEVKSSIPTNFNDIINNIVDSTTQAVKHATNTKVYSQLKRLNKLFGKKVDIVIPVYNAIHLTETCIRTLYARTEWPFHLTVVDDASSKTTNNILNKLQKEFGFDLLVNKSNHGFAATINRGVKHSDNPYIVLLNSDVLVTEGWLTKMLLAMEDDPRNQIVNPVTNNTALINVNMYPGFSYIAMNKALEVYSERKYPEIMPTGFCYMVKRDTFASQGYFSPNYINFGEEALATDTLIPTPSGNKTVGGLEVGDEVFSIDGSATKINKITEVFENRPCYKFIFNNGQEVISDEGHKWKVLDREQNFKEVILITKEIANSYKVWGRLNRFYIPTTLPVEYPEREALIDPYLLGAWLGDGTTSAPQITTIDPEILEYFRYAGWNIKLASKDKITYSITNPSPYTRLKDKHGCFTRSYNNSFRSKLRQLNVLDNKHIPYDYEFTSIKNRLALLQGLMDTDGHCGPTGKCTFANTNKAIIDSVQRIISSLGIYCSIISCKIKYQGCAPSWKIHFRVDNTDFPIFRLARKLDRQLNSKNKRFATKHLRIAKVEKVESKPVKCIGVEHPSHLFLCSSSFIPTHNTSSWLQTVTKTEGNVYPHYRAVLADDTYVFHQRNVSFATLGEDESMKLRVKAKDKFHKQWPQYGQIASKINCTKDLEVLKRPLSSDHLNFLSKSKYRICWLVHSVEMCGGMMYIADIVNEINERGGDARVALIKRREDLPVKPIGELRTAPIVFESYQDVLTNFTSKIFSDGIVVASTVELSPVVTQLVNNVNTLKPLLHVQSYEPELVDDANIQKSLEAQFKLIPNVIVSSNWVNDTLTNSLNVNTIGSFAPGVNDKIFHPRNRAAGDDRSTVLIAVRKGYHFKGYNRAINLIKLISHIAEKNKLEVRILTYGIDETPEAQEAISLGPLTQVRLAETLGKEVDVFIDPSHIHSYGLPALEALASGCTVVSWDNKGINEYAKHNKNAVIFDNKVAVDKVALEVVKLLVDTDRRKELTKNYKDTVKTNNRQDSVNSFIAAVEKHFEIPQFKKIFIVTPHLRKHGGPTTILNLANGLKAAGHEVQIGTSYSDLEMDVVKFTDIPITLFDLANVKLPQQADLIDEKIPECDILISNSDNPLNSIFLNSKKAKKKIMLKLSHNGRFKELEEAGLNLDWDAIITTSGWLKEACEIVTPKWSYKTHDPKKVFKIGWNHYSHELMSVLPVNKDFGNMNDRPIVIGSLIHAHPSKGTINALKVFDAIHKVYGDNVRFIGVGEVTPRQLSISLNNFSYNPRMDRRLDKAKAGEPLSREELAAAFAHMDIWLGASHTEGLGRMGLEAMSASCACVLTDTGPEYAKHGENAILAPIGDLKKLTEGVALLIANPNLRRSLAINGYETARLASLERDNVIKNIGKAISFVD